MSSITTKDGVTIFYKDWGKDAVHIGHSTGGGEVVRYIARHGESHR